MCKVSLVVQGQRMRRKGEDGVGDDKDAFSSVPAARGFCTIFSLATQQNMFTVDVEFPQAFVQGSRKGATISFVEGSGDSSQFVIVNYTCTCYVLTVRYADLICRLASAVYSWTSGA